MVYKLYLNKAIIFFKKKKKGERGKEGRKKVVCIERQNWAPAPLSLKASCQCP